MGLFIRSDAYGGAGKGEREAFTPTQPRRPAWESVGGATHEPRKTHPTLLDLALPPSTKTLRPVRGDRQGRLADRQIGASGASVGPRLGLN